MKIFDIYKPKQKEKLRLFPCPFCGSKEIVYLEKEMGGKRGWEVLCMECMAEMNPGDSGKKEEVQKMWNRRSGLKEKLVSRIGMHSGKKEIIEKLIERKDNANAEYLSAKSFEKRSEYALGKVVMIEEAIEIVRETLM